MNIENQPEGLQPEEGGALYQSCRESIAGPDATPEDLAAYDTAFQETLNNLTKRFGEEKALQMMDQFETHSVVKEKLTELLEQRKI